MRKTLIFVLAAVTMLASLGAIAQDKTRVVNARKVYNECKLGKQIQLKLKALYEQKKKEIDAKKAALDALQKQAQDPKISQQKMRDLKNKYNQKYYIFQAYVKSDQDDMRSKAQQLQGGFQKKFMAVVNQYARSQGFALVLEQSACLYNANALDITPEIVAAMNQAYPGT